MHAGLVALNHRTRLTAQIKILNGNPHARRNREAAQWSTLSETQTLSLQADQRYAALSTMSVTQIYGKSTILRAGD